MLTSIEGSVAFKCNDKCPWRISICWEKSHALNVFVNKNTLNIYIYRLHKKFLLAFLTFGGNPYLLLLVLTVGSSRRLIRIMFYLIVSAPMNFCMLSEHNFSKLPTNLRVLFDMENKYYACASEV